MFLLFPQKKVFDELSSRESWSVTFFSILIEKYYFVCISFLPLSTVYHLRIKSWTRGEKGRRMKYGNMSEDEWMKSVPCDLFSWKESSSGKYRHMRKWWDVENKEDFWLKNRVFLWGSCEKHVLDRRKWVYNREYERSFCSWIVNICVVEPFFSWSKKWDWERKQSLLPLMCDRLIRNDTSFISLHYFYSLLFCRDTFSDDDEPEIMSEGEERDDFWWDGGTKQVERTIWLSWSRGYTKVKKYIFKKISAERRREEERKLSKQIRTS